MTNKESLLKRSKSHQQWGRPAAFCLRPQKILDNSPKGFHYIKCGSKIWSYCSYCAYRYQLDQRMVVGSGCLPGMSKFDTTEYKYYALTLSAPSFGKVHAFEGEDGDNKCFCGAYHSVGDPFLGVPVDSKKYAYRAQVMWNANVNELLRYSMKYATDKLPGVAWAAAREWQQRGVLHIHLMFRFPKDSDDKKIMRELKKIRTYSFGDYKWGRAAYIDSLPHERLQETVSYLTKSLGKTARQQSRHYGILSPELIEHYSHIDAYARMIPCSKKEKCIQPDCSSKAHTNFGWNGHLLSQSTNWSVDKITLKSIRADRVEWIKENIKEENSSDYEERLREVYEKNTENFASSMPVIKNFDTNRANRLLDYFNNKEDELYSK